MIRFDTLVLCSVLVIGFGCPATADTKRGSFVANLDNNNPCEPAEHRCSWFSFREKVDCQEPPNCPANTEPTNNSVTANHLCMSNTSNIAYALQVVNQLLQRNIDSNVFVTILEQSNRGTIEQIRQQNETLHISISFPGPSQQIGCSYSACDVFAGDRWPYSWGCSDPKFLHNTTDDPNLSQKCIDQIAHLDTQSNGIFRCWARGTFNERYSFAYLFIGPRYYAAPAVGGGLAQIDCHATRSHFSTNGVGVGTSTIDYTCVMQSAFTTSSFLNSTFRCLYPDTSRQSHEAAPRTYSLSESVHLLRNASNDPITNRSCVATSFYDNREYIVAFLDMFDSFRPHIAGNATEQLLVARFTSRRLSCQSSGVPQPNVIWFYNNQILAAGHQVTVNDTELTVHWMAEAGTYECLATNGLGSASKQFVVTLIEGEQADNATSAAAFGLNFNWLLIWVLMSCLVITLIFVFFLLRLVFKHTDYAPASVVSWEHYFQQ